MPELVLTIVRRVTAHPLFLLLVGVFVTISFLTFGASIMQAINPAPGATDATQLGSSILAAALSVFAYLLFVLFVERKPFTDFETKAWLREWSYGAGIGSSAMVLSVAVIAALGGYVITGSNGPWVLVGVAAMAIQSGIVEEILFRGLLFRFLEQWLGSIVALAISALLFGLLHIGNPNSSWLAAAAISVEAGILLGAVYMITRRLWAVIGLHMAWNAVQGGVFGVKVSGTDVPGLLISEPRGSELLSGGAFGVEASLPAMIIATSLGIYFLWRAYKMDQFVWPSLHRFLTGEEKPEN